MRVQPAHVRRAALRPRSPAVVHGRNAVDRERFSSYGDGALEVSSLIEVTIVSGTPSELSALFRLPERLGLHRVHGGVMDIEGKHDRTVFDVDGGPLAIVIPDVPVHVRTKALDSQRVLESEV